MLRGVTVFSLFRTNPVDIFFVIRGVIAKVGKRLERRGGGKGMRISPLPFM